MRIPLTDWQFWATTLLAVAAFAWIFKGVLPIPYLSQRHRQKKRQRRVNLTVGGRTVAGRDKQP